MQRLAARSGKYDIIHGCRLAWAAAALFAGAPAGAQGLDDILDDLIENEIEEQVESEVAAQIEGQIESAVEDAIDNQVASTVSETAGGTVEGPVREAGTAIGEAGTAIGDSGVVQGLGQALQDLIGSLTAGTEGSARFAAGVDPDDRAVEGDVWVVLVPVQFADRIETWGFDLLERRDLGTLDRVLLRIAAPGDRDIAQAALDLALDAPGTVVDYNHVYDSTGDEAGADGAAVDGAAAGAPALDGAAADGAVANAPARLPDRVALAAAAAATPFAIGMVDSIVDPSHPMLEGVAIEQQDFVPFGNDRTVEHGTAVASIIAGAGHDSDARGRLEKLRVASVFFEDDAGHVRATTAGLVAAVDWLAGEPDLGVINMSLAGPPNKLLEVALGDLATRGIVVVAAVGNNGPTGAPLFPAAYESVVGVTAVDASHRVYRYANRGRQVMFSALGVQVQVASPSGGYRTQSGTSLAAPQVTALIGESMAGHASSSADVLRSLQATALDLGERDYDEIYGYGLVRRMR